MRVCAAGWSVLKRHILEDLEVDNLARVWSGLDLRCDLKNFCIQSVYAEKIK